MIWSVSCIVVLVLTSPWRGTVPAVVARCCFVHCWWTTLLRLPGGTGLGVPDAAW